MKRRDFLKAGAVGLGTVAGTTTLITWVPRAFAATIPVSLNIVAGNVEMIDGTLAYMFGFSDTDQVKLPGTSIICQEGDMINISLVNTLNTATSFAVTGTNINVNVAANSVTGYSFTAPAPGTYLYHDARNGGVNRVMGLHGALIVMPFGYPNQSFAGGPSFIRQYKWILGNVDTVWGEAVRTKGHNHVTTLSQSTFKPNYFTINGQSYEATHLNKNTDISGMYNEAAMVRILNAGMATHSPHFHANHVEIVSINRQNIISNRKHKDVVSMFPLDCRDVIYPFKVPPDAYPPLTNSSKVQQYPMHCHSEMSQSAGGGLYPHGMHTGINIIPPNAPDRGEHLPISKPVL